MTRSSWIPGKPNSPGYYWFVQRAGGELFGPAFAYIYDGYPDDAQPPARVDSGNPEYQAWKEKTAGLGTFLRVRFVEGLGAGDHELRRVIMFAHLPLVPPALPNLNGTGAVVTSG